jgi:predicted DsbA family dithiol-disulfide isomerase
MSSKTITIDLWTDIACPWCYVGETCFELAKASFLQSNPNIKITTNIHSYMIDPSTKENGEDYLAYNKRRWGGDGWTNQLKQVGKQIGCTFKNWKFWANTFKAHMLLQEAKKKGKEEEVIFDLYRLSYEEGENISDVNVLNKLSEKYQLTNWNNEDNKKKVIEDDSEGKNKYDIHGVPMFMFRDSNRTIEGAAEPKKFIKEFEHCLKNN